MSFHVVTYSMPEMPGFESFRSTHIHCPDRDTGLRLISCFLQFYSRAPKADVRELDYTCWREEVPFVHDPHNAGSGKHDKFFVFDKFDAQDYPELIEVSEEDFLQRFSEATGRPAERVCAVYTNCI